MGTEKKKAQYHTMANLSIFFLSNALDDLQLSPVISRIFLSTSRLDDNLAIEPLSYTS